MMLEGDEDHPKEDTPLLHNEMNYLKSSLCMIVYLYGGYPLAESTTNQIHSSNHTSLMISCCFSFESTHHFLIE